MSNFTWNEVDVLACLETEPQVDADRVDFQYDVMRGPVRIMLTISPYHREAHLVVFLVSQAAPSIEICLNDLQEIRYVKRDNTEELEFLPGTGREDRPRFQLPMSLRVAPVVAVRFGG